MLMPHWGTGLSRTSCSLDNLKRDETRRVARFAELASAHNLSNVGVWDVCLQGSPALALAGFGGGGGEAATWCHTTRSAGSLSSRTLHRRSDVRSSFRQGGTLSHSHKYRTGLGYQAACSFKLAAAISRRWCEVSDRACAMWAKGLIGLPNSWAVWPALRYWCSFFVSGGLDSLFECRCSSISQMWCPSMAQRVCSTTFHIRCG